MFARSSGHGRVLEMKDPMPRITALLASLAFLASLAATPGLAAQAWSVDRNGDGYISRTEFYAHLGLRHSARDRSQDGFLEAYELTGRFVGGAIPFTKSQARSFIASFDLDGDGKVSLREMVQAIEFSGAFDQFDTNDDGRLSQTETRALPFLNSQPKRQATMPGYTPIE